VVIGVFGNGQASLSVAAAAGLRAQITAKEVQISTLRAFAAEQNPDLIRTESELAALRRELARMQGTSGLEKGDVLLSIGKAPKASLDYLKKYRDVKYAIPFGIQLLLFMTPIIYPSSFFPERFRWLLALNPLSGLIETFRYAIVPSYSVHWDVLGLSLAATAALLIFGAYYFKRTEKAFADII